MSVYSKDADKRFATVREAQSAGFEFCEVCNDYLQNHNITLLHGGDNASYHTNPGTGRRDDNLFVDKRGPDKTFSIGVEVEKMGRLGYSSAKAKDLWNKWGWRKENDGSLTNPYGHELVSPIFSLFDNKLIDEINMPILRTMIDGESNDSCGGHIHIGSTTYTPKQLFEGFSAFFPLLYALYEKRMHRTYSQAKEKYRYYTQSNDHHTGIQILTNTIEFRIPPAVTSVNNLIWRIELMRIFAKNINTSETDVVAMLQNIESDLYKHLSKVMSRENINIKIQKFIKYTEEFNWKKIIIPAITERRTGTETGSSDV